MNKTLLALYGLKWNPFSPELPIEALHVTSQVENFCWRVEQGLVREGGFALITGEPGTGKSAVMRLLAHRLGQLRDLSVGAITHPSSNLADFYREMGDLFGVELKPHNRWGGFKSLRERWLSHLEGTCWGNSPLRRQYSPSSTSLRAAVSSTTLNFSSLLNPAMGCPLAGASPCWILRRQVYSVSVGIPFSRASSETLTLLGGNILAMRFALSSSGYCFIDHYLAESGGEERAARPLQASVQSPYGLLSASL